MRSGWEGDRNFRFLGEVTCGAGLLAVRCRVSLTVCGTEAAKTDVLDSRTVSNAAEEMEVNTEEGMNTSSHLQISL